MEEEWDGEVLLLVTLGARGPCEASPFPSWEQVTTARGALEMEEKQHFVGLRAESAPAGVGHCAHPPVTWAGRGTGAEPPLCTIHFSKLQGWILPG